MVFVGSTPPRIYILEDNNEPEQFELKTEVYTELQSNESAKIQNLRKLSPTNLNDHLVIVYHYFNLLMSVLLNLRMMDHGFSISFYIFKLIYHDIVYITYLYIVFRNETCNLLESSRNCRQFGVLERYEFF